MAATTEAKAKSKAAYAALPAEVRAERLKSNRARRADRDLVCCICHSIRTQDRLTELEAA